MASYFEHSGSISQARGSRHQAPESRLQTPDSRLQAPAPRLYIDSRFRTRCSRVQAADSRFETPGSRSQAPDSRFQWAAAVWQCLWQSGCKRQRQSPAAQARQARPTAGQAEAHAQPGPASFAKMAILLRYTAATPLRHQSAPRRLERAARVAFLGGQGAAPAPRAWAQAHGPGAKPTAQANTLGSLCSGCCLRDAVATALPRHPCDR